MVNLPRTPPTDEFDAQMADLIDDLKAAADAPLTAEDLAWFESLPELQPLEEGRTFAIFFTRAPASTLSNRQREPAAESPGDAAALRRRQRSRGMRPGARLCRRSPGPRR
jgi:hypothetical protein